MIQFAHNFIVVVALTLCLSALADPADSTPSFDREAAREKALAVIKNPPVPNISITGFTKAPKSHQKLLRHYRNNWAPLALEYMRENIRWYVYTVSLDRALYRDEAEKQAWTTAMSEHLMNKSKIMGSNKFVQATKTLYDLSRGMDGLVPQLAERYWNAMAGFNYRNEDQELVKELAEVVAQIKSIRNNSPISEGLGENQRQSLAIRKAFYAGEMGLVEAAAKLDELETTSLSAMGHDIGLKAAELQNRKAIILTKLAQNLGFNNHAEYMFAQRAHFYSDNMKTPSQRIAMLEKIFDVLEPVLKRIHKTIAEIHPLRPQPDQLSATELGLLYPESDTLVNDYYRKETVGEVWKQFYTENGFPMDRWEHLDLDIYPRKGKYTHAYMAAQALRMPKTYQINASDLGVNLPSQSDAWLSPVISIVQNIRINSTYGYKVVVHETGHFWDYASQRVPDGPFAVFDSEGDPVRAISWAETPSTSMEKVRFDRDLLLAKLRNEQGQPIPEADLDRYLATTTISEFEGVVSTAKGAWYDYSLWNYAYTENSESFVQRMETLHNKMTKRFSSGRRPRHRAFPSFYSKFSTDHFTGASVKYDYFFSDLAAELIHEHLMDRFEQETGRRSYLNQPSMGTILTEELYPEGRAKPFPQSIEDFTGMSYNPSLILAKVTASVDKALAQLRATAPKMSCPGVFLVLPKLTP